MTHLSPQHVTALAATLVVALATSACTRGRADAHYSPRVRAVTITTVPLLVKEQQSVLPFLEKDFAKGGVLEGKE
ncbi:MAG: hypothetical protein ACREBE_13690, partial [bacterium]